MDDAVWTFGDTLWVIGYWEICHVRRLTCTIERVLSSFRVFGARLIGRDPGPCEPCPLRPQSHYSPVLLELCSALSAIAWGLWMVITDQPQFNSVGREFITASGLDLWGMIIVGFGILQLASEVSNNPIMRRRSCFTMAITWGLLAWTFAGTRPAALLFVVQCLCQSLRYLQLVRGAPGDVPTNRPI